MHGAKKFLGFMWRHVFEWGSTSIRHIVLDMIELNGYGMYHDEVDS